MHLAKKREEWFILFLILTVAVFFRFYQLGSLPPGLWPDEAVNGVDALKALDATDFSAEDGPTFGWRIFYPANNGREGLFINMQAISIWLFGATPFALRVVSAIIGTLTVFGLYLLAKQLFNRRVASVSAFFLAISFWHVNFSRIGFQAIMLPFIMVFAFYFLWRGLRNGRLGEFFMAGVLGGLGFYTYFSYRIVPLIAILLFINYWYYLKKDFSHKKYEYARNQLLRGFTIMALTVIITTLPIGLYFLGHIEDFLKHEGRPISVFAQEQPLKELATSVVNTLAMFNFVGDHNQRHNIPGSPQLVLPIGLLFAVGFLRELAHWLSRKHGHFSPIHTFMFSWFLIMLIPGFLSTEAPHALRTIGVIPIVMIFAAQGFWWLMDNLARLHRITDPHAQFDIKTHRYEAGFLIGITIIISLAALGFLEFSRYFQNWATNMDNKNAIVGGVFNHKLTPTKNGTFTIFKK
ncbi:MAG: glycosyltransferase family 39 protein [Candidatus Yanofskybacteria bacterium]|nr:glycosyltransferase family 39 protein [Candidatus Yanofskybacteria bacterium]